MRRPCHLAVVLLLVLVALLTTTIRAHAQVVNPTTVEFAVSADHNATQFGAPVVARYELRVYAQGATAPLTSTDLGKPAVADAATVAFAKPSVFAAVPAVGVYEVRVVAIGPGGEGASGAVPFAAQARAPGSVTGLSVR